VSVSLTIEWEGLDAVERYLAKVIPEAIEEAALKALDEAAGDGVERAKQIVPVMAATSRAYQPAGEASSTLGRGGRSTMPVSLSGERVELQPSPT